MRHSSAICTLFERNYHYGVGALVNSLCAGGYQGTVWAGYRGDLPFWAEPVQKVDDDSVLQVTPECTIRFVKLSTDIHLTNYKPRSMLDLWESRCPGAESLFYFDPDITIHTDWYFFEEWVSCGVALCEDLNSPVNPTHPLRLRWKRFFEAHQIHLNSPHTFFVNGGFIGVSHANRGFLELWDRLLRLIKPHAAGLQKLSCGDRSLLFQIPDQDALNAAVYSTEDPLSVLGTEGMDFRPGGYTMAHSAGAVKPWDKRMLRSALGGRGPSMADKKYWEHTDSPIKLYPDRVLRLKRLELTVAAAIGRFIRRS